jgi:hypothetical protein
MGVLAYTLGPMGKVREQLTGLNVVRAAAAFAAYKLIEDWLGDGSALDGIGAEVVMWVVGLIGAFVVVVTLPFIAHALPYQLVPRRRARNQALGARCIQLASEMVEFLADSQRREPHNPPTHVPPGASEEERHRDWVRSGELRHQHETAVLAEFKRKFSVRLTGILGELVRADLLTDEDVKSTTWSLQTIHWIEQVPQVLAEKGYELTEGEEPPRNS